MKKKEYNPMEDYSRETGVNPIIQGNVLVLATRAICAIHEAQEAVHTYNENFNYCHDLLKQGQITEYDMTRMMYTITAITTCSCNDRNMLIQSCRNDNSPTIAWLLPGLN